MNDLELLQRYGITTIEGKVVRSAAEAKAAADEIGYPVAVKIVSPVHKTDIGAVKVGVEPENIERAYEEVTKNAQRAGVQFDGVIVQKMAERGLEAIVGVKTDLQFGKIILFGIGGIYAEIFKDFSIRVCPITEEDGAEMIDDLRSKEVFAARGKEYDKEAIVDLLLKVNEIAMSEPIREMDINPVILYPKGSAHPYVVIDARILR